MTAPVTNADQAARIAADQAILASLQDTFAVGGAIIDNATGTVLQAIHNTVLKPPPGKEAGFALFDPTGHGERQLVDWYYANASPLSLPAPSALTVVTSLDPCAMCAGALLTAGFNVGVAAIDTFAGINYTADFTFPTLNAALKSQAQRTWGYYAVPSPINRAWQGGTTPVFATQEISAESFELCGLVFSGSVQAVREADNASGNDPTQMSDPYDLPADSKVRAALAALYSDTLKVRTARPRFPGAELAVPLITAAKAAEAAGNTFNAVALIDPFGNLLTCTGGVEKLSPIRTAFLESTRSYALMRWNLMNDSDPAVVAEAERTLTHAKWCTFVQLIAPDPATPQAVMTFGAYGSTMEGALPQQFPSSFQYVQLPAGVEPIDIATLASMLPPFYTTDVQAAPMQVLNEGLRLASARS